MKPTFSISLLLLFLLSGCIKDDIVFDEVTPEIRLTTSVDSLEEGTPFQLEAVFNNNVGQSEEIDLTWESSDDSILEVDQTGLITAIAAGTATISVMAEYQGETYSAEKSIVVGETTVITNTDRGGSIMTTSSYILQGDFTLVKEGNDLRLTFQDDYIADDGLPGLYIYLTNNPSTISGALEISAVSIFSGAHEYIIGGNIDLNAYNYVLYFCKPFNVKVGDGTIE